MVSGRVSSPFFKARVLTQALPFCKTEAVLYLESTTQIWGVFLLAFKFTSTTHPNLFRAICRAPDSFSRSLPPPSCVDKIKPSRAAFTGADDHAATKRSAWDGNVDLAFALLDTPPPAESRQNSSQQPRVGPFRGTLCCRLTPSPAPISPDSETAQTSSLSPDKSWPKGARRVLWVQRNIQPRHRHSLFALC